MKGSAQKRARAQAGARQSWPGLVPLPQDNHHIAFVEARRLATWAERACPIPVHLPSELGL